MLTLLLATQNKGKLVEIQAILASLPIKLILPSQMGLYLDVVEDGQTYAENAARKALAFTRASGLITLADDSGLEVDALGGMPGIHSARYSPLPHATDADRRAFLLQNLVGKPRPWTAHFHCTVAVARPDERVQYAEGDCPGEIIPQERGQDGFGYDPIFYMEEFKSTMAELGRGHKNQISHRARALQAAEPILRGIMTG
jgi:XTP/dITP diphosphohydrolase